MQSRKPQLALAALLALTVTSCDFAVPLAPQPPDPPFKPHPERVVKFLAERHKKFAALKSIYAEFKITLDDRVWKTKDEMTGSMRYVHPSVGRLDVEGKNAESYIVDKEQRLWEFKPTRKSLTIYVLPSPGELAETWFDSDLVPIYCQWLLPVTPAAFDSHYELEIVKENEKEIHLKGRGLYECVIEELVIDKTTLFPIRITFTQVNNSRFTVEFTRIWPDIEIDPNGFVGKRISGWDVIERNLGSTGSKAEEK